MSNRLRFKDSAAFTLVELLVVIGVLALGLAMLAPALARTRTTSPAFQCMDNARQIATAWILYAGDNNGSAVPNSDGINAGKDASHLAWVAGWQDFTSGNTDNTNTSNLVDHDRKPYGAYLGAYVGRNPAVFRCPGDHSAASEGGVLMPRVRSISMNMYAGNPTRVWDGSTKYPLLTRTTQILSPAILFVTLDEHPGTINDGWFATVPDQLYGLVDFPATYHANGTGFSFADGHAEIHKWKDPHICLPPQQGFGGVTILSGDPDVLWLSQHALGLPAYP